MVKAFMLKLARWSVAYVPYLWGIGTSLYPESVKNFFVLILNGNTNLIPISNWHIAFVFIASLVLFWYGITLNCHIEEENKNLKRDNISLKESLESLSSIFKDCGGVYLEQIWLIFLDVLYRANNFTRDERISLYCYNNGQNGHFIMLARSSDNPELKAKGRGVYKANEGCIWLGWTDGVSCINGLPDYKNNQKEYLRKMYSEGKISKTVIKSLHMKPRSIGSFAINDLSNKSMAVVVVESNAPDVVTSELITTIRSSEEINNIRQILTRFGDNLPKMNTLKEKGF